MKKYLSHFSAAYKWNIPLKQNRCFVDLYYPRERVAVEYDSFKYHSNPKSQGRDLLRSSALESQGIEIVRFSTNSIKITNSLETPCLLIYNTRVLKAQHSKFLNKERAKARMLSALS